MNKAIVFDTSFLMNAVKAGVDPIHDIKVHMGPFDVLIPSAVMEELRRLSKKDKYANVVVELLKKRPHTVIQSGEIADDAVVHIAAERHAMVASTDKEVRQKAKSLEIKLVTLREGKYIWVEGLR